MGADFPALGLSLFLFNFEIVGAEHLTPFCLAFPPTVQCGGMLPWLGWKMFLFSTLRPGNGGPLQQPKGQKSVFYSVPPPLQKQPEETEDQKADQAVVSENNDR